MKLYKFEGYLALPNFLSVDEAKSIIGEVLDNDESSDIVGFGRINAVVTDVTSVPMRDEPETTSVPGNATDEQVQAFDDAWVEWFERARSILDQHIGEIPELEVTELEIKDQEEEVG
jgi:hypothetical protein